MTQAVVGLIASLASLLLPGQGQPVPSPFWGALTAGPHEAGLKVLEVEDPSRPAPGTAVGHSSRRPLRIYLWYPARPSARKSLTLADYARQAELDLPPLGGAGPDEPVLPTALARGMMADRIRPLLASPTRAYLEAPEAPGPFPVLVLGQGLYYESPLAHFVLCEYLASHGYIVASCPLLGTRYRLTNLSAEDLETQVRDMEFALAHGLEMKPADRGRVGAIGFDLGGMSGLLLAMRNPGIDAYLSLDSGILMPHPSGLPGRHPSYHEDRFRIPWMHANQARFLAPGSIERKNSLYDRKAYGDSYLVHMPTTSHGDLSSYAMLELVNPVPGYWGARDADPRPGYEALCRAALAFFDGYIKGDEAARASLRRAAAAPPDAGGFRIEGKEGRPAPPTGDEIVQVMIEKGFAQAVPDLERALADAGVPPADETVLNWLGMHFLNWWGREEEALDVFRLATRLYPRSSRALDLLGQALAARGKNEDAVVCLEKALALDPGNKALAARLEMVKGSRRNAK